MVHIDINNMIQHTCIKCDIRHTSYSNSLYVNHPVLPPGIDQNYGNYYYYKHDGRT